MLEITRGPHRRDAVNKRRDRSSSAKELAPQKHSFPTDSPLDFGSMPAGRLVKHARYYWLLLAESHLTRRLFGAMVGRIAALPVPTG